jgi:hypothetical protein
MLYMTHMVLEGISVIYNGKQRDFMVTARAYVIGSLVCHAVGLVLISIADVDVDIYFRHNQLVAAFIPVVKITMFSLQAWINSGAVTLYLLFIPAILWAGVLVKFRSIVNMEPGVPRYTYLWAISILTNQLLWCPVDVGLGLHASSSFRWKGYSFKLGYIGLLCFDLIGFTVTLLIFRWSSARGDNSTNRLYVVFYAFLFGSGLQRLGYLSIRVQIHATNSVDLVTTVSTARGTSCSCFWY